MINTNPIGIFDSGIGGLSIARSIRNQLPNENLLYVADSYNAPYGNKSIDFIYRRSSILMNFLLEKKAKAIVIACNTATVSVIQKIRKNFSIPVIGVEPGIKPATLISRNDTRLYASLVGKRRGYYCSWLYSLYIFNSTG